MEPTEKKTVESTRCGGNGGNPWDDGILFDGVVRISYCYDKSIDSIQKCVQSIRVVYGRHGKHIKAERHGDYDSSNKSITIELEYPGEYITKVSGSYVKADWIDGDPVVIHSLQFDTNRNTCNQKEVQGNANPNAIPFTFRVEAGTKIIGMFGRSGKYLDAIGFHVSNA